MKVEHDNGKWYVRDGEFLVWETIETDELKCPLPLVRDTKEEALEAVKRLEESEGCPQTTTSASH